MERAKDAKLSVKRMDICDACIAADKAFCVKVKNENNVHIHLQHLLRTDRNTMASSVDRYG